ncbi:MAG TPA: protein kinase [Candidatus Xenobia bacterium]
MPDTTVTRIGPYQVVSVLGRGGMGTVFRVRDGGHQDVALKLLATITDSDPLARLRFQREFRILAALDHPNLVKVLASGEHEGRPWYTMEWLIGRTLSSALPAEDRLQHVVRYAIDVARGLDYIHQCGIIHRDLKPANIMVLDSGVVKLTDFGLAREIVPDVPVSRSNTMVGTIHYMAPEQIVSGPVDARTDLYSFGVMLYELAAGKLPVSTGDWMATINDILEGVPDPPGGPLNDIIMRLLEKAPENRYQTGHDVVTALADTMGIALNSSTPVVSSPRPQLLSTPLLGREDASLHLLDALDRVVRGETQVVTLTGPPGMGGTRLCLEVVRQARRQGFQVFAEPLVPGRERSYQSLIPWLRWLAGLGPLPEVVQTLLEDSLAQRPADPTVDRYGLLESVARHVRTRVVKPTLVLLDPLLDADEDTRTLLGYLASDLLAAPGVPLFLLTTQTRAALPGVGLCLRPLTEDEGVRLLQGALGGMTERPDWLVRLVGLAGGNPGALLARLRSLLEDGALQRPEGQWTCRPEDVPSQGSPVRLDDLPPDMLDTLRRLTLLGGHASFKRLQACSPLAEAALVASLDRLLDRRLVASDGLACDPQAMQSVWTGLEAGRRQSLHRDIALGLEKAEPEAALLIARHYGEGGLPERALGPYQRALKDALAQRATDRAATIAGELAQAMEGHASPAETRLMVLDGLIGGDAAQQAAELARRWLEGVTDHVVRAGFERRLGQALQGLDRHEQAMEVFCRGLETLGLRPGVDRSHLPRDIARLLWRNGPLVRRLTQGEAVQRASAELSAADEEAIKLFLHLPETFEFLPSRPPFTFLITFLLQQIDLWRQRPSNRTLSRVYTSLTMVSAMRSWPSHPRIRQQAQRLRQSLHGRDEAQLAFILGITAWRRWDLHEASRCLRESYQTATADSESVQGQIFWVAACDLFLGQVDEARTMAAQMGAKARWMGQDRYAVLWDVLHTVLDGRTPAPPPDDDGSHQGCVARFLAALAIWLNGDSATAGPLFDRNSHLQLIHTIYHFHGWDGPLLSLCTGQPWRPHRDLPVPREQRVGLQYLVAGQPDKAAAWFGEQGWYFWQAVAEGRQGLPNILERAQSLSCKATRP